MYRHLFDCSPGFSLVEVLAAIILISILAAVGASQYLSFNNDAKSAISQERMVALKVGIIGDGRFTQGGVPTRLGFEANCQGLPTTLQDLVTQPASGTCAAAYDPYTRYGWRGPYVSSSDASWDKDGWGTALLLNTSGAHARTLQSCGNNGVCGDGDDIYVSF